MRPSLPALILPMSLVVACEAGRSVEPPRRPMPRPAVSASAPIPTASASASSSAPAPLVAADNDPLAPLPPGAIARCGTTRMRILDSIESVAVSDSGSVWSLESEGSSKVVKDIARGSTLFTLPACTDPVLSHDGSFVVAAMQKPAGEIAFFRTSDGQRLRAATIPLPQVTSTFLKRTSTSPARVDSIVVSGDDKRVVVLTSAKAAHVIDSEQGKLVASFAFDGDLIDIDRAGMRALATRRGESILSLNPKGWFVVDLAGGKVLRRYEPKTGGALNPDSDPDPSYSAAVALSADGKQVFAKDWNDLWTVDVSSGTATKVWGRPVSSGGLFGGLGLGFMGSANLRSTPGGGVAFVDESGAVEWHPQSGSLSHLGKGRPIAFSPSGLVVALQDGRLVRLAGHDIAHVPDGHSAAVSSLSFLGGGSVLASGGNDLRMWRVPEGSLLASTSSHGAVQRLAGSADGTSLALHGAKVRVVSASGRVVTLNLKEAVSDIDVDATGRRVALAFNHWGEGSELAVAAHGTIGPRIRTGGTVKSIAFAPGGESIASLEQDDEGDRKSRVVLRDASTLDPKSIIETQYVSSGERVLFAGRDDRLIVYGTYRGAMLFDLGSKTPVRRFSWGACCDKFAVSRDGKLVAGSIRDKIALWDGETRKLLRTFSGHTRQVNALAFSPDGRILASGSDDTTVLLWDVSRAGTTIAAYERHELSGPASSRGISAGTPIWYVLPDGRPAVLEMARGKLPKLEGVREIATNNMSSCALKTDGKISCWGWTRGGVLGIPEERVKHSIKDREVPVELARIPQAASMGIAGTYGCALTTAGSVWCWGTPAGSTLSPSEIAPHEVTGSSGSVSVAVSSAFACAARNDGKVACWGTPRSEPVAISQSPQVVAGVHDATAVAAGEDHVCALRRDGTVLCWGDNGRDQLGNNTGLDSPTPVQVAGVSQAVQLVASSTVTCARTSAGAVWCWGQRNYSPSPGFPEPEEVPPLAGSTDLRASGPLVCGDTAAGLRCIRLL